MYTMPIKNECNKYSWGSMLAVWDGYCMDSPAETTEDPDTCSCDVSKYDFEDLKERLERVERSLAGSDIGSLESTVNDVLNGVSTMQQCIAKMVLPGMEETTEMPRDTTKMDYETTMMDTT